MTKRQPLDEYDGTDKDQVDETAVPVESPKRGNGSKKKRDNSSLRKAPQAPKRFKSSYICFFMAKQPEIKEELGEKATVTEISKRSAEMWYVTSLLSITTGRYCLSKWQTFESAN